MKGSLKGSISLLVGYHGEPKVNLFQNIRIIIGIILPPTTRFKEDLLIFLLPSTCASCCCSLQAKPCNVGTRGYLRVPLKGYYKGTIKVPLKGSIRGI